MGGKTILLLLLGVLLIISVAFRCAHDPSGQQQQEEELTAGGDNELTVITDIGQGNTVFRFEVTGDNGIVSYWNVHTNAATVGEALVETGLIEGDVSEFGLMVHHVNGLRADYVEDGAWWAFYINGEMAMTGVDSTEIEEGVIYAFIFTEA